MLVSLRSQRVQAAITAQRFGVVQFQVNGIEL